jgi:hypothetical protein
VIVRRCIAYVDKILALCSIWLLDLQEDVADRVNDQDFAVLRNDTLLGSYGAGDDLGFNWTTDTISASLFHGLNLLWLAGILLHGAPLTAVPGDLLIRSVLGGIVFRLRGRNRGRSCVHSRDTLETALVTKSSLARHPNVPLPKLLAASPRHEESEVVEASTHYDEQADHDGTKARTEALVVVPRASPCWETVPQEVVVALALGALQHGRNNGKPLVGGGDLLHMRFDLLVGRLLADLDAGTCALLVVVFRIVGDEDLAGLVGVKLARPLAVGFGQLLLRRAGLDAEEIVERDIVALGFGNFIADAEDFVVCNKLSASSSS